MRCMQKHFVHRFFINNLSLFPLHWIEFVPFQFHVLGLGIASLWLGFGVILTNLHAFPISDNKRTNVIRVALQRVERGIGHEMKIHKFNVKICRVHSCLMHTTRKTYNQLWLLSIIYIILMSSLSMALAMLSEFIACCRLDLFRNFQFIFNFSTFFSGIWLRIPLWKFHNVLSTFVRQKWKKPKGKSIQNNQTEKEPKNNNNHQKLVKEEINHTSIIYFHFK